jgi:hypothetical protein
LPSPRPSRQLLRPSLYHQPGIPHQLRSTHQRRLRRPRRQVVPLVVAPRIRVMGQTPVRSVSALVTGRIAALRCTTVRRYCLDRSQRLAKHHKKAIIESGDSTMSKAKIKHGAAVVAAVAATGEPGDERERGAPSHAQQRESQRGRPGLDSPRGPSSRPGVRHGGRPGRQAASCGLTLNDPAC